MPNLVKETEPNWVFSKGLLGNKGFKFRFNPVVLLVRAVCSIIFCFFATGVIVAVGLIFNLSLFNLEFVGSAGVRVTEGAMSLPRLFDGIFSNEIVGVIVTLGDFDLPLAGVSVQEPKIEKKVIV